MNNKPGTHPHYSEGYRNPASAAGHHHLSRNDLYKAALRAAPGSRREYSFLYRRKRQGVERC